jgi:hypothetical protein
VGRGRRCTFTSWFLFYRSAERRCSPSISANWKVETTGEFPTWLMADRDAWVQSGGRAKRKAAETATGDESDEQSDEESSDGADTDEGQVGDGEEEEKDKSKKKRAV